MTCGIYLITRKDTSQKYVGQAKNIEERWKKHIGGYDIEHSRIDRAIIKHGVEKFNFQIITKLPYNKKILDIHEKYWVKFYNTYEDKNHYNLTPGGDFNPMHVPDIVKKMSGENHSFYGKHHTEETRRKISESKKGKSYGKNLAVSKSNRRRTGENHPLYGQSPSEETLKKQSESKIGEKNAKWGTSKLEKHGGLDILFDAIKNGKTQEDIAKELDISVGAIVSYLHTRNYSWIKLKKEVNLNEKYRIIDENGGLKFIIECIKNGKTLEDVSKKFGLSAGEIQTYLRYNGYTWAKLKKETPIYEKKSIIDECGGLNFLRKCIKDGKTQEEVAKELKLNKHGIPSYLKKKGYTWTKLKKEVHFHEKYGIIDENGGLNIIIECIKNGKTLEDASKELGLSIGETKTFLSHKGYTWTKLKREVVKN